ncbi:3'-5' exonuclease, partial [Salmonella enterica]|nr:3'-5' exonuclease [Salmonella enterica]
DSLTVYCAMRLAAGYYGPTNRYGTISLSGSVSQAGLSWAGEAHSAVTDTVMTAQVVNNIAGYWHELQCEMNDDAGSEPA